uniref:4-aminobutyrate--2-oxoglutarate transaminase n=1 Tax=Macrostomum lignano TaxID=282301 RepID=A0A1I8IAD6_9PLAT
ADREFATEPISSRMGLPTHWIHLAARNAACSSNIGTSKLASDIKDAEVEAALEKRLKIVGRDADIQAVRNNLQTVLKSMKLEQDRDADLLRLKDLTHGNEEVATVKLAVATEAALNPIADNAACQNGRKRMLGQQVLCEVSKMANWRSFESLGSFGTNGAASGSRFSFAFFVVLTFHIVHRLRMSCKKVIRPMGNLWNLAASTVDSLKTLAACWTFDFSRFVGFKDLLFSFIRQALDLQPQVPDTGKGHRVGGLKKVVSSWTVVLQQVGKGQQLLGVGNLLPAAADEAQLLEQEVQLGIGVSGNNGGIKKASKPSVKQQVPSVSQSPASPSGSANSAKGRKGKCAWDFLRQKHETKSMRDKYIASSCQLFFRRDPLKMVRGSMQYMYEQDGTEYLDCINNVAHVGHCHPHVVQAGFKQMRTLQTNNRYLHDHIVTLAERLCSTLPSQLCVCFFVNS